MATRQTQETIAAILSEPHDAGTVDKLVPLLYEELRQMARREMSHERPGHTLNPTALANETYLRIAGSEGVLVHGRVYFLGAAAKAMRRVLVDHARSRMRQKRGGDWRRVTLNASNEPAMLANELIELDDALEKLAAQAPRQARVVEARYFGGLNVEETAELLGVSARTVKSDWAFARTWLNRSLN